MTERTVQRVVTTLPWTLRSAMSWSAAAAASNGYGGYRGGAIVPAVLFLEANRGAGSLDGLGMLFFDPAIRGIFGADDPGTRSLLADDDGIERLIDRLEELDAEYGLDA